MSTTVARNNRGIVVPAAFVITAATTLSTVSVMVGDAWARLKAAETHVERLERIVDDLRAEIKEHAASKH